MKKNQEKKMSLLYKKLKEIASIRDSINIEAAEQFIRSNIYFKGPNIWILICAIVIASVGLNVNSIPVIIGAMLVSPLMGPIMGVGMSLGINDSILLKKSIKNLLIMTLVSIAVSGLFFFISPLELDNPTELLARTKPTIYDVFIALFGGFSVILAVTLNEKGTIIAGAAIATALMPPLCTAGYGLAHANFTNFIGAVYLYLINSIFIALATFLTVKRLRFPIVKFSDDTKQKRVHRLMTVFAIILILPSIYTAFRMIKENKFNQIAKEFVTENKNLNNSYIYDYQIDHTSKGSILTISIAGDPISTKDRTRLYEELEKYKIAKDQLKINQTSTAPQESSSSKEVVQTIFQQSEQEIVKREEMIAKLESQLEEYKKREFPIKQISKEISAQYPNFQSLSLARGQKIENENIAEETIAIIKFKSKPTPDEMSKLRVWLAVRLNVKDLRIIEE